MNLDAEVKQLKREIERMKAVLSILEHLQRKRRMEFCQEAARRRPGATKKPSKR